MDATTALPYAPAPPSAGHHLNESPGNSSPRARAQTILLIAAVVAVLFVGLLAWGIVSRSRQHHQLESMAATVASTPPAVSVVHPTPPPRADWSLPGTTQAIDDAIIYARVSGYLSQRYVDIGDRVKAGQLLAEIQSPELDQQLNQARANLQQAFKQLDLQKANLELARITMQRYKEADQSSSVAKLLVDQAVAGYAT